MGYLTLDEKILKIAAVCQAFWRLSWTKEFLKESICVTFNPRGEFPRRKLRFERLRRELENERTYKTDEESETEHDRKDNEKVSKWRK